MTAPKIAPLPMESMQAGWQATLDRIPGDGLKGRYAPRNVLGTLMHAPNTLGVFFEFWVTAKQRMTLSVREQELVILRMGVLYGSEYVWRHHVPVAREFGLTEAELEGVRTGNIAALPTAREQALVALTGELVEHRTLSDAAWSEHGESLPHDTLLELISLVAQYVLFALTNNVYRVALEEPMLEIPGLGHTLV